MSAIVGHGGTGVDIGDPASATTKTASASASATARIADGAGNDRSAVVTFPDPRMTLLAF